MGNINEELDTKISKILTKYKKNTDTYITNLVLSGGGLKGLATLAAIKVFYDNKLLDNLTSIAASSVGALIAGLYCIGYTFDELYKLVMKLDIDNIVCANPANFLDCFALDTGERFEYVITKIIESKNLKKTITLKEVYEIRKINLVIACTCLNTGQICYFSHISTPDIPLLTCIRMSTSIPIIFKPVIYKGNTYVDGSVMDNYPIHLFKNDLARTIGIYVKDAYSYKTQINSIESYAYSLLECALEGQTISTHFCEDNTLVIELPYTSLIDGIDMKTKKSIYLIGHEKAKQYVNSKYLLKQDKDSCGLTI